MISFSNKAAKQLKKLPQPWQGRLKGGIQTLTDRVNLSNIKALKGKTGQYRLRVGEYRVIYETQRHSDRVLVLAIGHRRDIYR